MGKSKAAQRIHGLALIAASAVIKRELRKEVSAVRKADFAALDLTWYLTDYDDDADFEATLYISDRQDLVAFGRLTVRYGDGTFNERFGDFETRIRLGDFTVRVRTTCAKYTFGSTESGQVLQDAITKASGVLEAAR
ncbi:hypothetical protein [Glycomyces buryatensis]|uniref:Uncharacterized protein n=1 Tax=Glycomyces buryatensis TaxID=2570927 RepID=A0A4S8QCH1_9ACTN|nr:hypothetical protein [Glycomyces buryatensis]THV40575.1 hypothetical protein FAB82_15015 [Glycomyces buryatensis]